MQSVVLAPVSLSGLCQCGCGQPAPVATQTRRCLGHIKGVPSVRGSTAREEAAGELMTKILVRKDDPDYRIELVRRQDVSRGWWGMTATMITNRRAPCVFPRDTWTEISESGGTN